MMKKYRFERKGRRNFDTVQHYNAVDMIAAEKTRTANSAVRATCSHDRSSRGETQKTHTCTLPLQYPVPAPRSLATGFAVG